MDQLKIGKYISEKRKEKGLTQAVLADSLGITDRAVSKWERGKGLPDASIMLELCDRLEISVNELLSGEDIDMKDYNKKAEENLLEMKKQNEQYAKAMLKNEWVIGAGSTIIFFGSVIIASYAEMPAWARIVLIGLATVIFIIGITSALRIEQVAGYYECQCCHHKYVPKFSTVFFSMHIGRTRYMRCPKCNKHSWQKKVINND